MHDATASRPRFEPGDVVVCVDAIPCARCGRASLHELQVGSFFRIARVGHGPHCCGPMVWGVTLVGVQPTPFGGGYVASRFRRIDGLNEPTHSEAVAEVALEPAC